MNNQKPVADPSSVCNQLFGGTVASKAADALIIRTADNEEFLNAIKEAFSLNGVPFEENLTVQYNCHNLLHDFECNPGFTLFVRPGKQRKCRCLTLHFAATKGGNDGEWRTDTTMPVEYFHQYDHSDFEKSLFVNAETFLYADHSALRKQIASHIAAYAAFLRPF